MRLLESISTAPVKKTAQQPERNSRGSGSSGKHLGIEVIYIAVRIVILLSLNMYTTKLLCWTVEDVVLDGLSMCCQNITCRSQVVDGGLRRLINMTNQE